jgi:hypothetical protein
MGSRWKELDPFDLVEILEVRSFAGIVSGPEELFHALPGGPGDLHAAVRLHEPQLEPVGASSADTPRASDVLRRARDVGPERPYASPRHTLVDLHVAER